MLQAIFEQLYDAGFKEFAFIVGKGKRAIEDHFSPDEDFIQNLKNKNKKSFAEELQNFLRKNKQFNYSFHKPAETKRIRRRCQPSSIIHWKRTIPNSRWRRPNNIKKQRPSKKNHQNLQRIRRRRSIPNRRSRRSPALRRHNRK